MFRFTLITLINIVFTKNIRGEFGQYKNITCPNGNYYLCPEGTQDCYDNSTKFCNEMFGKLKNVTCPDGTYTQCSSGTHECYDNSTAICNSKLIGQEKTIECYGNRSEVIYQKQCPSGTRECYDNSPRYCQ